MGWTTGLFMRICDLLILGWVCNLIMYWLYSSLGFDGIYGFVLILSGIIMAVFFSNLVKEKNGMILSFLVVILAMYFGHDMFTARNQLFSFLVFELEIYCLIGLLEQGKKRYFWYLLALAFALVLVHDTLYVLYFVWMMPYLADWLICKIFKINEDTYKFQNSNLKNIKYLIILLILAVPIGLLTPVFGTSYTNLVNCMGGVSTSFINELQPVNLIENVSLLTMAFVAIGLIGFTKTKFKIKDVLFVFGLLLFAMMANRNMFFLYYIGSIYLMNMITECINTYVGEEKKDWFFGLFENSKYVITVIFCFTTIIAIKNISYQLVKEYVNEMYYPIQATDWILENVDYENARIWTHFNWGSYLELKGIKVYLDSRSGMYTEEENEGCTVLKDWLSVQETESNYKEIFEKYGITHVVVSGNETFYHNLAEDENYKMIYEDNSFKIYQKIIF